jgi:hypothetical protein
VGVSNVGSTGTVNDTNGWHHVAVTSDVSQARFFIDGVLDVERAYGPTYLSAGGAYTIGSRGASQFFKGLLDEVAIYNRALSADEIATIYSAGSLGLCKNPRPTTVVGLAS